MMLRNRIRSLISAKNVTDKQVSEVIGKSKSYISNVLAGRNLPSMSTIFLLCNYFEITVEEFFNYARNPLRDHDIAENLDRLLDEPQLDAFTRLLRNLSQSDIPHFIKVYQAICKANGK